MPKAKINKLTYKLKTADGSTEMHGEPKGRGVDLCKMFEAAITFGEGCVPGLTDVLDRYIADVAARKAETAAELH